MNFVKRNLKELFYIFFFVGNIFYSAALFSQTLDKNSLALHGGYTFSMFSGQKTIAVYLSVFNNSNQDVTIEKIQTDISKFGHIHTTKKVGDVVKMTMLENVKIEKGKTLFFQPGGKHIMLTGLNKSLKLGDSFSLNLITDNNDVFETNIMVLDRVMKN